MSRPSVDFFKVNVYGHKNRIEKGSFETQTFLFEFFLCKGPKEEGSNLPQRSTSNSFTEPQSTSFISLLISECRYNRSYSLSVCLSFHPSFLPCIFGSKHNIHTYVYTLGDHVLPLYLLYNPWGHSVTWSNSAM